MGCGSSTTSKNICHPMEKSRLGKKGISEQLNHLTKEERLELLLKSIKNDQKCISCQNKLQNVNHSTKATQTENPSFQTLRDTYKSVIDCERSKRLEEDNNLTSSHLQHSPNTTEEDNNLVSSHFQQSSNTTEIDFENKTSKRHSVGQLMETVQEVEPKFELPNGDTPKNEKPVKNPYECLNTSKFKNVKNIQIPVPQPKKKTNISRIKKMGSTIFIEEEDLSVSSGSLLTLKSSNMAATHRIGITNKSAPNSDISENEFEITDLMNSNKKNEQPNMPERLPEIDFAKRAEEKAAKILGMEKNEFNMKQFGFKRSVSLRNKIKDKFNSQKVSTPKNLQYSKNDNVHRGFSKYLNKKEPKKKKEVKFTSFEHFSDRKFLSQQRLRKKSKIVFAKNTPEIIREAKNTLANKSDKKIRIINH